MDPTHSHAFFAGTGTDPNRTDRVVDGHESVAAGPPGNGGPAGRADDPPDPSGGWMGTPKRTLLLLVAAAFLLVLALGLFLAAIWLV